MNNISNFYNLKTPEDRLKFLTTLEVDFDIKSSEYIQQDCVQAIYLKLVRDKIYIQIDSESKILKGIFILLMHELNNKNLQWLQNYDIFVFINQLKLANFLTKSRENTIINIYDKIKKFYLL